MSNVTRVGLIGIENSHAAEIVRYLNVERADKSVRVSAIVRGDDERTAQLAELGGIDMVVDRPAGLLGEVDAVIDTSRDGALHVGNAVQFLEAGIPVWIDKPFATTAADAEAMLEAAERGGVPLTSSSALRWVPDTTAIMEGMAGIGTLQAVTVTGPADPHSQYSGIFFYGIHAADIAQRLVPGRPGPVEVVLTEGSVIVRYRTAGVSVTLELVRPDEQGSVPFRAVAVGRHGVVGGEISLPDDYVQPGVDAFIRMLQSGEPPIPVSDLVAPIAVLEAVRLQEAASRR